MKLLGPTTSAAADQSSSDEDSKDTLTKWRKAIQIYLKKKHKFTTIRTSSRVLLVLLAVLVGMTIGLLFPRKLSFEIIPESVYSPDNKDPMFLPIDINFTTSILNPNLFEIDIIYLHADVFYGPLWLGRKQLDHPNIRLLPKTTILYPVQLNLGVNITEILEDFSNPSLLPVLYLLLNTLVNDLASEEITLRVETTLKMKALNIELAMTELYTEEGTWSILPGMKSSFISTMCSTSQFLTRDFFTLGSDKITWNAPPPLPQEDKTPYWFFVNFGTLLVIFLFLGGTTLLWNLSGYYYANKMKKMEDKILKPFSHINRLTLKPSSTGNSARNDISFHSLGLKVGEKTILEGVSGKFAAGRLTAIMGPSGCGKTSMLSVLSGRASYGKTTGYVKINGKRSNISKFKKIVGFVPQEDIMIRVLTVEEILEYSAYTRVSSSISNNDLVSHIEEVIQLLSLDKIRDSVIGDEDVRGISGGQRKRVNIAMEWVASPGMLFLDEPTSGLDSTSSIEVCQVLRNLAHNAGLTIVAVIHQPRYEIFQMFDDIAFLGVGGRPVYLGPTSEVAAYFKVLGYTCPPNLNPADYYLDVVSGIYGPPTPSLLSITDLTTCQMLQEFWEQETQRKKASKRSSSLAPSIAPINPDESSVSLDDGSLLLNPVENKTTPPPNPLTEFVVSFLICLVLPWSLIGFETDKGKKLSVYSKFGGIFGVLLTPILICPPFIRRVKLGSLIVLLLLIISLCVAGILANLYAFFKYHKNNRDPAFSRLFMLGILYGPFSVLIGIFVLKGNRKLMAALSAGTLFLILVALVIAAPILYELNYPTNANWKFLTVTGLSNASFFVFSRVVTYIYRYLNVSLVERETRGILFLTFMAAKREFIVQMRNWKEILFHIIQITFGGLFLGFIFYDRPYKGPVFSFMSGECPTDTPLDILKSLCYFLLIPVDDPILAISSLSTLTIALCAVSYAISIFGKEVTVFKRESSTGGNTGAYYIGKSLAHLPMTLFAPVCYLLAFCGLGYLKADWSWHYIILTLTYASFTGVGYAISLLTPPRVSQLAGIFFVLVLMMFSGGQPTLKQLLNNELVGFALYVPTYFSYTRWANELVYLWEIKQYTADYRSMQALYGYYMYDELYCLGAMFSFFLFFRVITYIALVVKEHK